ncbi:MAG: NADH-quinone oxidoreductase subunit NuoH [Alphaproteobacteria bacterium]|nr:NADH-quinone oxidoreductase subunit NuoH [Alphaproteobacteria bacterium]MCL2505046.1 NADH-quinone oxidoreductase subunit NuoH [Alphaproteobacteria bacterium]
MEFFYEYLWPLIWIAIKIGLIVAPLMGAVAYLTYAERKVLAAMQLRKGPNVVGPFGVLQPVADGIKLLGKEMILPAEADKIIFVGAPIFAFFISLIAWAVIPFGDGLVLADINVGLLYLIAVSSLCVYGILFAGWSSNSKYPFLSSLRAVAQLISYELVIGVVFVCVILFAGSLNLSEIVKSQEDGWFAFTLLFPIFIIYIIAVLAETNRHPFDLPEGESEIVAGFHTEYSSMAFAMFFLSEYANMILLSSIAVLLFLGGWLSPIPALDFIPGIIWFFVKVALFLFIFLWVRATLPRYRYDQLMSIGWKVLLPISFLWVVVVSAYVTFGV